MPVFLPIFICFDGFHRYLPHIFGEMMSEMKVLSIFSIRNVRKKLENKPIIMKNIKRILYLCKVWAQMSFVFVLFFSTLFFCLSQHAAKVTLNWFWFVFVIILWKLYPKLPPSSHNCYNWPYHGIAPVSLPAIQGTSMVARQFECFEPLTQQCVVLKTDSDW